ncbi:hypothetical protein BDR07DRAFT_1477310 [Suillus spraguei]|nr:hypothetical protein BDR07DRAFT_1477310 [Suillus spraguei]
MKVLPNVIMEQTFNLSELMSAVELIHTQNAITHNVDGDNLDLAEELLASCCPACECCTHRHTCYVCGANIQDHTSYCLPADNSVGVASSNDKYFQDHTDHHPPADTDVASSHDELSVSDTENETTTTTPHLDIAVNPAIPTMAVATISPVLVAAATTTFPASAVPVLAPAIPALASQSSTVSTHWYSVTVGHETGVFRGWHNVHPHVIGISGACFKHYSSYAAAEAAYLEAIKDGGVVQVPP